MLEFQVFCLPVFCRTVFCPQGFFPLVFCPIIFCPQDFRPPRSFFPLGLFPPRSLVPHAFCPQCIFPPTQHYPQYECLVQRKDHNRNVFIGFWSSSGSFYVKCCIECLLPLQLNGWNFGFFHFMIIHLNVEIPKITTQISRNNNIHWETLHFLMFVGHFPTEMYVKFSFLTFLCMWVTRKLIIVKKVLSISVGR